jgi:hypothetical protein
MEPGLKVLRSTMSCPELGGLLLLAPPSAHPAGRSCPQWLFAIATASCLVRRDGTWAAGSHVSSRSITNVLLPVRRW